MRVQMSNKEQEGIGPHINKARQWLLVNADSLTESQKTSLGLVIGYASMTLSMSRDVNN